jgi:Tol biopolymer transport system component/serine/threonine protein kinase
MVTHHDGKPVPKVIDFGIAKATNQKLTEKTVFTRYAHLIGTPAYMSPEQAELSDLDIDTRSDIYSLGVLLYELLTGTTPFSEEELRKAGYIEMQRVIREQEPAKPSTKLSTLGETLTDIAKHRGCTPDLLRKVVRGDLDWIVMKSLEKGRARRYETASGLAEDIRRHLEHEPVLARGPNASYRLCKFLRRHRSQTIAALVAVLLAGAAVVVLSLWNRDRAQLAEAEGFRDRGILSQAREQYAKAEREAALETIKPILQSKQVGPEAQLLRAGILVDNRRSDEAVTILESLLGERPEIAGTAHALLARILWETGSPNAEKLKEIEEHRRQAEALLPETAEAYFLRAMTAMTIREQLATLDKALQLDPSHYESRRLRAFTYYASRKYEKMEDDALVMAVSRPRDPVGCSLRAVALRELGHYQEAMAEYDSALALTSKADPQRVDLSAQRSETLLRIGDHERVIADAQECLKLWPGKPVFQYHIFCALTALGEYEKASTLFRQIIRPGHEARRKFQDWCMKYVSDALAAGRVWHPADRAPEGPAFLSMLEAEETYRGLSAKGHRVTTDGFSGRWSTDGKKLAFSLGVHGYSGVAVFDPGTRQTELLIVPGKDPRWSPDGKRIAFVRDCQALRLEELATIERKSQHRAVAEEEVWIMNADGSEPRRLVRGSWPSWCPDSTTIYYQSRADNMLCSIPAQGLDGKPRQIMKCASSVPSVSPDGRRVAYLEGASLKVKDLATQALAAEWPAPSAMWGGIAWSPTGRELCLGGRNDGDDRTGLWIYSLGRSEPLRVLDGPITVGSWSPDGTKLEFCLAPPYFEIWAVGLDPNVSTIEALGPGQRLDEHFREMVALYTRRIETDPQDASAYSGRAHYYDCLHDRPKATADMRRWSAVLSREQCAGSPFGRPPDFIRVFNLPFDGQIILSAQRLSNETPVMSVAFGQKGRWEMKLFEIPMFVMSLFGLGLFPGIDTPPACAHFTFGEPVNLETVIPVLDGMTDMISCFTRDGLEMHIKSYRTGGYGEVDCCVLRRGSIDEEWGPLENLGPSINTANNEGVHSISADGLTLYLDSDRPGGHGGFDIYMSTRATRKDPWGSPVNMGPKINSSAGEGHPAISADGLELYFISGRSSGYGEGDIYVTRRASTNDPWGEAVNLGPAVNSAYSEFDICLSPDGLLLLFSDEPQLTPRPGGYGGCDMWVTRRASRSDPWQTPVNLGPKVNGPRVEGGPRVSNDGRVFYFWSGEASDTFDNWQVPILPVVDFNGDGKVDEKDQAILKAHWSENYPLCDIGPFAWGDGVVDANDLVVLSEYMGKKLVDPTLLAHWSLDETEGAVAHDGAGKSDGGVVGSPAWLPTGGRVGGALQFDGKDDLLIIAQAVPTLEQGAFSVVAWVKGGAPGQVVLCRSNGAKWLYLNPADGCLATELKNPAGGSVPLVSTAVIADGQWHRIGLVWDGEYRILYADEKEVARDTQSELTTTEGGFMIGAGTSPGTFWSGLIDDVRIYDRVVQP